MAFASVNCASQFLLAGLGGRELIDLEICRSELQEESIGQQDLPNQRDIKVVSPPHVATIKRQYSDLNCSRLYRVFCSVRERKERLEEGFCWKTDVFALFCSARICARKGKESYTALFVWEQV